MGEPKIGVIGYGGQGKTLANTILLKAIHSSDEMKLLQAYKNTGLTPEEIKELQTDFERAICEYNIVQGKLIACENAEEQGLLINISNVFTTEKVKDIFHTLMQGCYGVPIPKEITDNYVDDLMR